jgi:hypothetical protein
MLSPLVEAPFGSHSRWQCCHQARRLTNRRKASRSREARSPLGTLGQAVKRRQIPLVLVRKQLHGDDRNDTYNEHELRML